MLCHEGKISLYCFALTSAIILVPSVPQVYFGIVPNVWGAAAAGPFFYFALVNMLIRFMLRGNDYQIAVRASFLGLVFSLGLIIAFFFPVHWKPCGIYASFLAFFHYSEFLGIAWSNPSSLSLDSFILNHSIHYGIAIAVSWIEFAVETYFFPEMKTFYVLWFIGIAICLFGEVLRKLAMITAKQSFNHLVQYVKAKDHKLITNGIYAYVRHPSYVGWFWWSIGTQIILFNPFCIIMYTIVSWKFFKDRIFIEEITLLNFFGHEYFEYQQRVPVGLPFIKGYHIESAQ